MHDSYYMSKGRDPAEYMSRYSTALGVVCEVRGTLSYADRVADVIPAVPPYDRPSAHPQDAESLRGEVERLRAAEQFTISDGGRLLHKSDVVGVCEDSDLCFERADDVARCGPCARKLASAAGVEMRVGECIP